MARAGGSWRWHHRGLQHLHDTRVDVTGKHNLDGSWHCLCRIWSRGAGTANMGPLNPQTGSVQNSDLRYHSWTGCERPQFGSLLQMEMLCSGRLQTCLSSHRFLCHHAEPCTGRHSSLPVSSMPLSSLGASAGWSLGSSAPSMVPCLEDQ